MQNIFLSVETTQVIMFVVLGVVLVGLVVMSWLRNKKTQQKTQEVHSGLKQGDKIMTIGGIIGTIVDVKSNGVDKILVIETGEEGRKTTFELDIKGLYQVLTPSLNTESTVVNNVSEENTSTVNNAIVKNDIKEKEEVFEDYSEPTEEKEEIVEEKAATSDSISIGKKTTASTQAKKRTTTTKK